jgi:DNA-binding response OmpR family regulator
MSAPVLIIDDDKNLAKAISRTLKQAGLESNIAQSGFEAGLLMGINRPKVITLDLNMPHMSGSAVLELIRQRPIFNSVKILIISAATQTYMKQMLDKGANDFLNKPFDNAKLVEKVTQLLASTED